MPAWLPQREDEKGMMEGRPALRPSKRAGKPRRGVGPPPSTLFSEWSRLIKIFLYVRLCTPRYPSLPFILRSQYEMIIVVSAESLALAYLLSLIAP